MCLPVCGAGCWYDACLGSTRREHDCIKHQLERTLRLSFERLCVLPQHLNKCFDWDVAGTRWQRVGMSLAEAYGALGVRRGASVKDVKAAFHRVALHNHPDKVTAPPGSAAAEEAALHFMKSQKAFETIMEARRAKPPSSPPPPTHGEGRRGSSQRTDARRGRAGRSSRPGPSRRPQEAAGAGPKGKASPGSAAGSAGRSRPRASAGRHTR